jgi:hypothetical protein
MQTTEIIVTIYSAFSLILAVVPASPWTHAVRAILFDVPKLLNSLNDAFKKNEKGDK